MFHVKHWASGTPPAGVFHVEHCIREGGMPAPRAEGSRMTAAIERFCAHAEAVGLSVDHETRVRVLAGAAWLARASGASGLSQYRDPDDALLHAMGPALTYFAFPEAPGGGTMADIGAGNGAIGATIGLFAPEMQIRLVDRARRAYTTAELLVARLKLPNVKPVLADASRLGRHYDVVVFRALAPAVEALPLAATLVDDGGFVGAFHRPGDGGFERPSGELAVLGSVNTLVPEMVLTCYRK